MAERIPCQTFFGVQEWSFSLSKEASFITYSCGFCPHRWRIIPNVPEKFPSVFLEQLLPAVGLLRIGQHSVGSPHRAPVPRGPVLLRLLAQPPPPAQSGLLAPVPSPPPSPPPSVLTRRRYRQPGLGVPTSGGPRDVRHSVRPAVRLSAGAVGEAPSPPGIRQLGTGAQRFALWPGREGGVWDQLGLEWRLHRSWSRDRTQYGHRYWHCFMTSGVEHLNALQSSQGASFSDKE